MLVCALFSCKCKIVGTHISAVIIYIHSLIITVMLYLTVYTKRGRVSVFFKGNTNVYIFISVPLFSVTGQHLQTKTVERPECICIDSDQTAGRSAVENCTGK